jgi:hypothetical protein
MSKKEKPKTISWYMLSGQTCPYCNKPTNYVDSKEVYHDKSYGMIYLCKPCNAYIGVTPGTNNAIGRLANKELRELKKMLHGLLQILITHKASQTNMRKEEAGELAYKWVAKQLNLPNGFAKLSYLNESQCEQLINICKPYALRIQSKHPKEERVSEQSEVQVISVI